METSSGRSWTGRPGLFRFGPADRHAGTCHLPPAQPGRALQELTAIFRRSCPRSPCADPARTVPALFQPGSARFPCPVSPIPCQLPSRLSEWYGSGFDSVSLTARILAGFRWPGWDRIPNLTGRTARLIPFVLPVQKNEKQNQVSYPKVFFPPL